MKVEFQNTKKNDTTLREIEYGAVFRVEGEGQSSLFIKTEYTGMDELFSDSCTILNDYVHTGPTFDYIDCTNMICCISVRDVYIRFMSKDTLVVPLDATLVVTPKN